MSGNRLADYLDHIAQAASDACDFVKEMTEDDFLTDRRTQRAVIMSLVIIGEAETRVMDRFPDFAAAHPDVPWRGMRGMRGMRNRVAHGYFDVNLDLVWETVRSALPQLAGQLKMIRNDNGDWEQR